MLCGNTPANGPVNDIKSYGATVGSIGTISGP
jgi:hypothetical protein